MKKSKIERVTIAGFVFFISFLLLPSSIDNNFLPEEAVAGEVRQMTLKEKRNSYFSGDNVIFRTNKNIKILIVPGHDDKYSGAEFEGVREVDLNRELAKYLYERLQKEAGISVAITSDQGGYTKIFDTFFKNKEKEIQIFKEDALKVFNKRIQEGSIKFEEKIFHNTAPLEMATKLYGINLWANENNFDLVIHIHFNDYPGRYRDLSPKYNGFAVYIPDKQFKNYPASKEFAEKIFNRVSKISAISNLKEESIGIVEDQELIAIGTKDSLNSAALLIEYGYVYEPQFTHPDVRATALEELADQTYTGIKDYFGEKIIASEKYNHTEDLKVDSGVWNKHNYMLQKELAIKGFYPPKGKTLNECPVSGYFGDCTQEAVTYFQKTKGIPSTGFVGSITRKYLNSL